ncbi:MAG: PLD nuclease N-terminal domain-containing protein [Anaerolineae bacterium]
METLPQWLPLIIPLVVIQLILMVVALLDLSRREQTRGPKLLWVFVIILGELIGPLLYFLIGREE